LNAAVESNGPKKPIGEKFVRIVVSQDAKQVAINDVESDIELAAYKHCLFSKAGARRAASSPTFNCGSYSRLPRQPPFSSLISGPGLIAAGPEEIDRIRVPVPITGKISAEALS
jgi:hypothetical protein